MGDEKRGRRDEKPTKVDTKRIASLRKGGDKSKDVSVCLCLCVCACACVRVIELFN